MWRSIGSVVLGVLTYMVLIMACDFAALLIFRDRFPRETLLVIYSINNIVCGCFNCVAAGYVTAWVARRRELVHAGILAGIATSEGILYFVFRVGSPDRVEPVWYLAAMTVVPALLIPLGGWLRARHAIARGI